MILEIKELRDREKVFADREDAGRRLAPLVEEFEGEDPLLVAIPAGGVPVAAALAESLEWPLEVAAVSKITLPWNTEAGYGAVAFDGSVCLNEELLPALGLSEDEVREGVERTQKKVARRERRFRAGRPFPPLAGRTVFLIDDGLASGYTMRAGIRALRSLGAADLVVAIPTGHVRAVEQIAREVTAVCCANLRSGRRFAVAEAYARWWDVEEEEALERIRKLRMGR